MRIFVDHPLDRVNFTLVHLGEVSLAFSYKTLVGVRVGFDPWTLTRNYWGPTTGKHLNYLDDDHKRRLTAEEFAEFVDGLNITVKVSQ